MKKIWGWLGELNTRKRIIVLLCLVIVPFSALLIYDAVERYKLVRSSMEGQVLELARLVASNANNEIELTRQLLESLAGDPVITKGNWPACSMILHEFVEHFKDSYANFLVADPHGDVVCSGVPSRGVNIADRRDFQDVMSSRLFVVGDLVTSRTTGILTVQFRHPVLDSGGRILAVVTSPVPAERFAANASSISLPEGGDMLLVDRGGKIIFRKPESKSWSGKDASGQAIVRIMLSQREGVAEANGVDGVTRVYGFAHAGKKGDDTDGVHVAVGVPNAAMAEALYKQLELNIILVLGITAGVFAFAVSAFRETTDKLERGMETFREQSLRDPLTDLFNRRFLEDFLERELLRANRGSSTLAILMIDIDYFKKINDTYGHDCGDKVLIALADVFRQSIRGEDVASRFGGEEFILVLPGANVEIAKQRAEKIRERAQHIAIDCQGRRIGPITLSLGVSAFPAHGESVKAILRNADVALYEAKNGGRNRVIIAGQLPIS